MRIYVHVGREIVLDATPEQIQKVMNLYERPGTSGEKAAAEAALRRMGVDPHSSRSSYEPPKQQQRKPSGPRRYEVEVEPVGDIQASIHVVEANDELDAERIVRTLVVKKWRTEGGKGWAPNVVARVRRKL